MRTLSRRVALFWERSNPLFRESLLRLGAMVASAQPFSERVVDRYAIYDQIAVGGMAVVHLGRLLGQAGFSRIVAIKRLHPQFAADPEFVAMFFDEARLAVRVQHPNVVAPLDVVVEGGELLVVMEYVSGETLSQLCRCMPAQSPRSPAIFCAVLADALHGLHAAHEARAEDGTELHIVHRDVSPQNIIVGVDGVARVLDFGVAKAAMRSQATKEGEIKGKISYMAPEQLKAHAVDRRADIFAAGIVLWEALTGRRLFRGDDLGQTVERLLHAEVAPPSSLNPEVSAELDAVVMRALERDPARRFPTAREFAIALREATTLASPTEVADWVRALGGIKLAQRIQRVAAIESHSSSRVRVTARSPLDTPLGLFRVPVSESTADAVTVRPGAVAESGSGISATSAITPAPRSRLVAAALAIAVGAATLGLIVGRSRAPANESPAASASMVPPPAARPSTFEVSEPAAPAPEPSFANTPPSVTSASAASVSGLGSKRPAKPASPRQLPTMKPAAAPNRKATTLAANCNPPYVVDAKGIRRIKTECL
jgi:serine/threonine protein kinase